MNIFTPTPKINPSFLNSIDGETTALAKPSPEGGRVTFYDALGKILDILKIEESEFEDMFDCTHGEHCEGCIEIITPVLERYRAVVDALDINKLVEGTKYAGKKWVKIFEMEVIAKNCVKFPVTAHFDIDDWAEGKPLIAHYNAETKTWELVEVNEETGYFSATFNSLSPFVFFVEKGGAGVDSPTTGDPMTLGIAMMAAGATGLAVVSRKRK